MARVHFDLIFTVNPDGSITTKEVTRIGGATLPPNFVITPGVAFGGIDLTKHIGQDLEILEDNGVNVVTGIY